MYVKMIGEFLVLGIQTGGKVSKALKEVDYDKQIVFETFIPEVKKVIPSAWAWRNTIAEKTADKAAKDTLKFLKQKLE